MKAIIISEKEIDQAFVSSEEFVKYNHDFMMDNETNDMFKGTRRYRMLQMFRQHLSNIKKTIKDE